MHPVLFEIGPFKVFSYGAALAIAFLLAATLARRRAVSEGMDGDKMLDLFIILIISGIIGGRLLFVLLNIKEYLADPAGIFKLWEGGLVWYGGLTASTACGIIFLKAKGMPVLKTADLVAPYIALGQAIGRIGCYLNGCCYGKYKAVPAQLTESAAMFILFLILRKRSPSNGRTLLLYLILYSAFRFFNEFLRGDNPVFFAGLTASQVISIVLFASAAISWKIIPSK